MKAISNFKALLSSRSRTASPRLSLFPEDAAFPPNTTAPPRRHHKANKPSMNETELADFKRQNEAHAARLLEERLRVQRTRGGKHGEPVPTKAEEATPRNNSADSTTLTHTPPVLGVGTGGGYPPADADAVVADSPIAADFNIYDAAYEAEIERIRKSSISNNDTNNNEEEDNKASGSSAVNVYMTRHLGKARERVRGKLEGVVDLLEGSTETNSGAEATGMTKTDRVKEMFRTNRFAELVAQTIRDTREKEGDGKANKEEEEKDS